jgi:hypothetical protein
MTETSWKARSSAQCADERVGNGMANSLVEDIKHEAERGLLLNILIYRGLEWVTFSELRKQMMRQGAPIEDRDLQFHLEYLRGGEYVEVERLRAGRAKLELVRVRATKKAVDLRDGRLPADPGVAF